MSSICLPLHQSLSNQSVSNENGSNENGSNENGSNENCLLFVPLDDVTGLPFPLNSNLVLKLLMVSSYVFTLVAGTRIRFQIISFVKCPESNVGPINQLIWLDQIFGLFASVILVARIVFLLSPVPIGSFLDGQVCDWINLTGGIYTGGGIMWGMHIALFRVLFIKAQKFIKLYVGINNLLNVMIFHGFFQVIFYTVSLHLVDNQVGTLKMCTHESFEDQKIMEEFMVS